MKLETKHIAPYLPYGLKVQVFNIFKEDPIFEVGLKSNPGVATIDWMTDDNEEGNFKPLLRPLSSLTKEDENGFSLIDVLDNEYGDWATDYSFKDGKIVEYKIEGSTFSQNKEVIVTEYTMRTAPYFIMEFLFKHYFDVFGLIEQGLAKEIE